MVEVPSMEEFNALKAKVDALTVPQEVKDALKIVLTWMVTELNK